MSLNFAIGYNNSLSKTNSPGSRSDNPELFSRYLNTIGGSPGQAQSIEEELKAMQGQKLQNELEG